MANEIRMNAVLRTEQGSAAARRLRRKGVLPAVVKRLSGVSETIELNAHAFENTMRHHSGDNLLITLELGGADVPTLLREVQHDVLNGSAAHADFGEISLTQKIRVSIMIKLTGEAEGVKTGGGILEHALRQVEVACLPADMVETIEVDVSTLKLGETLSVGDLKMDPRYTILTHADVPVARVVAPAEEEEVAEVAVVGAAAAAGTEPEVIVKGKKEEAEEAAAAGKKSPEKK